MKDTFNSERLPSGVLELACWINEHRPDLRERLVGIPLSEARVVLNDETGLDVGSHECVETSCARFLEALKAKQEAS